MQNIIYKVKYISCKKLYRKYVFTYKVHIISIKYSYCIKLTTQMISVLLTCPFNIEKVLE